MCCDKNVKTDEEKVEAGRRKGHDEDGEGGGGDGCSILD